MLKAVSAIRKIDQKNRLWINALIYLLEGIAYFAALITIVLSFDKITGIFRETWGGVLFISSNLISFTLILTFPITVILVLIKWRTIFSFFGRHMPFKSKIAVISWIGFRRRRLLSRFGRHVNFVEYFKEIENVDT